ncbi:LPXTG-motif cell wall-anchored protein [Microbacterium sp. AG1240]|nr:LPXTG-motif cell wall-anchored protein [Microbacterium sp. AG1240]
MKNSFAKAAAVITLAAAATFAPLAAHAYPTGEEASVSSTTVAPGGTVEFTVADGTFDPGEPVTISLTGENASGASLAVLKTAVETAALGTVPAAADGSISTGIKFPANASGVYTITATSPSVPEGVSVTVSVAAAGAGTGGSNAGGSNAGGSLPATGMDSGSLLGLWVGGGALVLAGGAVAVGAAVHRQRKHAA